VFKKDRGFNLTDEVKYNNGTLLAELATSKKIEINNLDNAIMRKSDAK